MDELQTWQIIVTYSIVAAVFYCSGIVSGLLQERRNIIQWRLRCLELELELAILQKRKAKNLDELVPAMTNLVTENDRDQLPNA